jgi:MraZ protein
MTNFLGEFECRLDTKLRLALPSALKKQLSPQTNDRFVINRGFEKHLVLYPYHEWEKVTAEFNRLNLYIKKNREFVRYFHRGATELTLDGSGRLLLPRRLLAYAGIKETVALLAYANRIECWDTELYETLLNHEPEDFAQLAEEIMGGGPSSQEHEDTATNLRDLPPFLPGQRH